MDVNYFLYAVLIIAGLILPLYMAEYLFRFFKDAFTTFTTSPDDPEPDIEIKVGFLSGTTGGTPFIIDINSGNIAITIYEVEATKPIVYTVTGIEQALAILSDYAIDEETA